MRLLSRFVPCAVMTLMATTMFAGVALAGFAPGHLFVTDGVFHDADILEYDGSFNYIGNFKPGLPAGFSMNLGATLRFGPDGDLYAAGEYDGPGGFGRRVSSTGHPVQFSSSSTRRPCRSASTSRGSIFSRTATSW